MGLPQPVKFEFIIWLHKMNWLLVYCNYGRGDWLKNISKALHCLFLVIIKMLGSLLSWNAKRLVGSTLDSFCHSTIKNKFSQVTYGWCNRSWVRFDSHGIRWDFNTIWLYRMTWCQKDKAIYLQGGNCLRLLILLSQKQVGSYRLSWKPPLLFVSNSEFFL